MSELDFSPWVDGPPVQDECSPEDGQAYSDAVRQLQEKAQRGLSKQMVKQWGAHFKDKSCERCTTRRTPCVWRPDTAGCQSCHVSKLRCSKVERYASRLIAARLGLSEELSWARFQKWGKIRRPGGGRKSSAGGKQTPRSTKASTPLGTQHTEDSPAPALATPSVPTVLSATDPVPPWRRPNSPLVPSKRTLRSDQVLPPTKRFKRSLGVWEKNSPSKEEEEEEEEEDQDDEDMDISSSPPRRTQADHQTPASHKDVSRIAEPENISPQDHQDPFSSPSPLSLPPFSPKVAVEIEESIPLPPPSPSSADRTSTFARRSLAISQETTLAVADTPSLPPTVRPHPNGQPSVETTVSSDSAIQVPAATLVEPPPRASSSTIYPTISLYPPHTVVNIESVGHPERDLRPDVSAQPLLTQPREQTNEDKASATKYEVPTRTEESHEPKFLTPDDASREAITNSLRLRSERDELAAQLRAQGNDLQERLRKQREALEREFARRIAVLDARLEESESERIELQAEVEKANTLIEQERRAASDQAHELADYRHAYSVLLQGATEAGFSLRAGSRYQFHNSGSEPPSHEARAQTVIQDAIINAMDIVLLHHRGRDHENLPVHYTSQGWDGYQPSAESIGGQSSSSAPTHRRHSIPRRTQSPRTSVSSRVESLTTLNGDVGPQPHSRNMRPPPLPTPASTGSPQLCSASLHPRMRRLGREDSVFDG